MTDDTICVDRLKYDLAAQRQTIEALIDQNQRLAEELRECANAMDKATEEMESTAALIDVMKRDHDIRVQELLTYNTELVLQRRALQGRCHWLRGKLNEIKCQSLPEQASLYVAAWDHIKEIAEHAIEVDRTTEEKKLNG